MYRKLGCLVSVFSFLVAQEASPPPKAVLKIMPLALIDPFQYTLHGGIEIPVGLSNTVQAEGGWVFGHLGETSSSDLVQRGFKVRLSWREYFARKTPKQDPSYIIQGGYLALMGGYQSYNQTLQIDTSGGYGYFREYQRIVQGVEVAFLLGYHTQLGQRLSVDFWGGMGARYTTHRWSPARPPSLGLYPGLAPIGDFILRPGGRPVPRMGIAIGWILR